MDIRLLGPIETSLDSGPAALGPRQQRAVLAMLALQLNRTVSTDRLIEGLWGDRAPPSAPKLVQLYVSQLRKLLGAEAEIVTRGRGYELRLAADRVDAARFERLVAEAAAANGPGARLAREALALWRGPALADVADEPFAGAEIRRLDELRLRATELAIQGELAAGRHRELIGELEALVAAHPLVERLHGQRMLALYRSGRQAEALAAYRDARRVLVDEIGVEPDRELRRLHDAILRQDAAALDLPAAEAPPAAMSSPLAADRHAPPVAARTRRRVLVAVATLMLATGLAVFAVSRWSASERRAVIKENAVGVIDPKTARITAHYAVGRAPSALAIGGGSVWVANAGDGTVSRIEPGRDQIVIPIGERPADLAFAAGSLWVSDRGGTVSQISPAMNRVVRKIAAGNAPRSIVAGFGSLWVASEADRTVARIDLTRGRVTQRIELGASPTALAAGADAVWVTSEEGATVFRIEPRSGDVVGTIAVGNGPVDVAVADGAAWIANRQDATVSRVDPAADAVTDIVKVPRDPSAIAASEGAVWVANATEGTVSRIDPVTRRTAETIAVRSSPSAIAVVDGKVWMAALAAPATHRGGTLRVQADPFEYNRLEPPADLTAESLLSLAYDGLVAYRRGGGAMFGPLVGALATDVPRPSADGRTYIFRLRPKLRYSDGSPVRPEDFRASLEALFRRDPGLGSSLQGIVGGQRCARRPASCDLSAGIVTDARLRTITVHLTRPDGEFLHTLAYSIAFLTPAARPFGNTPPPGTGPYRIVSYHRKRGARLIRNPHFRAWSPGARPDGFADQIVVRVNPDREAQIAAVLRGEADVVHVVGPFGGGLPLSLTALATGNAGQLYTNAIPEMDYVFLNVRTPPFDDPRVRRALNYAVDRREITRLAGGPDLAQPTCQLLPPGFPNYKPSCPYTLNPSPGGGWSAPDIERARRLIEQSGTKGTKVTVWINKEKRAMARYFVSLLRELGYPNSLRVFPDYPTYRNAIARSRAPAQIGIDGWIADAATPSNFTPPFRCAAIAPRSVYNQNLARYCDRRLESRIDAALAAHGPHADALWRNVYRDIQTAAPTVPLVNRRTITLVSKRVGNYQHHPVWTTLLEQLWVR
ncbi:ABC transporter substrate-binding protein [Solirubrobacter taibaiensis]|nr:ABC transporter substrate-binding protein [Solirubrobacter taibaiensis]